MLLKKIHITNLFLILCIAFSISSCKSSKNIDKTSNDVDSVEVMRVDTVIVHKTDSIQAVKFDSGTTQISIIHFNYDSVIRKPYVSKVETYVRQNNIKESLSSVNKTDSSSLKKNDSTKVKSESTQYIKQKKTEGISLLNLLWFLPIAAVIIIVAKYWSKIKAIFTFIK